MVEENVAERWR